MRVGLFVTCLVDLMRPRIGFAALELLKAAGCQVVVPATQTCCGQAAYNAGESAMARSLAIKLLDEFESFDYVVLPSGSCTSMVRHHYPQLVADGKGDVRLAERMAALTVKTYELTDFLVNIAKIKSLPEKKSWSGELTYHDSCSGLRELGIKSQPRALLGQCRDVRLREMTGAEECCGFGGVFSARFGALSAAIAEKKCAGIHATGASAVVGGDLGCLLNIEGKLRRMGDETTQVLHIAEVLAGQGE